MGSSGWRPAKRSVAEVKNLKDTYKTKNIPATDTLPTTTTVEEYMEADQRVYMYIEAINNDDPTKITVSAVKSYDTAVAYTKIAAGGSRDKHTVGVKRTGTMWAWGDNSSGQLGDSNSGDGYE